MELLQSGPTTDTVMRAELNLDQAKLALEEARDNFQAAELRAPFSGVVASVDAIPGEYVGSAPIITLTDLKQPMLKFWVEESDLSGLAVGNRVEIVFEALPDETFYGQVIRVEPALVDIDNTLVVQAWASVDMTSASRPVTILKGMNADVEIITAEARDVLLVPIQALRELGEGSYAVFVVQPNGELKLRPVEVGLQDFVNAEIISGLEEGEIVSIGVEESPETVVTTEEEGPMMPPIPGFRPG